MASTKINYIEFKSANLDETKTFYSKAFGWDFIEYGDAYVAFTGAGIDGGFALTNETITNGVLIVLYHPDLTLIQEKVIEYGGMITTPIFSFPGGKRFHFQDHSGNEIAIWSE